MNFFSCFIYNGMLADAGDFIELLAPLILFGIYILGALAKKWSKNRELDSGEEKPSSELQKAVRKRYQQIYEKQTGKTPSRNQVQSRQAEQPQFVRQTAEKIKPVRVRQHERGISSSSPEYQRRYPRTQRTRKSQTRTATVQRTASQAVKTSRPHPLRKVAIDKTFDHVCKPANDYLIKMIREPENLRSAIILKEILDKPLGLREH